MTAGDNETPPPPEPENKKDGENGPDQTATPSDGEVGHFKAAPLIKQFGGIRPMANKLGVPVSTVQGWKQRDAIPASRLPEIEAAAKANAIVLEALIEAEQGDVSDADTAEARDTSGGEPAAPAVAAQPRGRGGGFAIALSIVALLVALGVGGGVVWLMRIDRGGPQRTQEFAQRITALETEAGAASALAGRLAALEDAVVASNEQADALARLNDALAAVESDLKTEIEALRGAPSGGADVAAASEQLDALTARVDALEQQDSSDESGARLAEIESSLVDMVETQSAFAAQLSETPSGDALTAVEGRLGAIEAREAELARLSEQITDIEGRLAAITAADVVEPRALALVLALQQLRVAVAAGQPFAKELDLARRLAGTNNPLVAPLQTLEPNAGEGLATVDQLRAEFSAVARILLQASLSGDASASLVDRLRARLAGIVSVRRTDVPDDEEGDSIDQALGRADAALAGGDLGAAVAALESHEEGAPADVTDWLEAARARVAADEVIAQADAAALAILSQAEPE